MVALLCLLPTVSAWQAIPAGLAVRHARAPTPQMQLGLPSVGLVAGVGLAAAAIRGVIKSEEEAEKFAKIKWEGDAGEQDDDDACVLLGEEDSPDG